MNHHATITFNMTSKEMKIMREMTTENIKASFAGESQAHVKYQIFASQAEKAGYPNIARLYKAIAYAELVHASHHFRTLGTIGDINENLQTAIGGETFEVDEMYPAYRAVAEEQDEKAALRGINYALAAEKIHAALYEETAEIVKAGSDRGDDPIHICPVCGFTHIGDPPANCPICGMASSEFKIY